ncbi:hypothetical protein MCOR25_008828 [Pyricularia grisea]|nr:hypothetical protein MCOR25_008828 [Pyricularia grisea]
MDIPLGRQITDWMNQIPNDGFLFFRGMLGAEYLVVAGAEGLHDVLFTRAYDFEKISAFRRYPRRLLAGGLVVQEGDAHKIRRRAVGRVFQPRNVDMLKPLLCVKSQRLVQVLRTVCEGSKVEEGGKGVLRSPQKNGSAVIDICDWATRFALDIACVVGFGEDLGLVERCKVLPILQAYTTIFTGSKENMSHYAWHTTAPVWLSNIFPHKLDKEMDEASRAVRGITLNAVLKRMDLIRKGEKATQDFMTKVVLSKKFNAQECADELVILMTAAWVTLLNAVLSEMMPLEPLLPMTLRKAVRNTSFGGHAVRAGTYIVVSPYAMGRSRAIWGPEAFRFDTERWTAPHNDGEATVTASSSTSSPEQPVRSPHGILDEHRATISGHHYGMLTFPCVEMSV